MGEKPVDSNPPVIALVGESEIIIEANKAGEYVDQGAVCNDNFDGDISDSIEVSGDEVNVAKTGVYQIKYNCKDSSGNDAVEIVRTVTVRDTVAPVITLNGSAEVVVEAGTEYNDVGVSAADSFDDAPSVEVVNGVNTNELGQYSVTYKVKDSSGNESTLQRTVIVRDTIAPVITLNGSAEVVVEAGTEYNDAGVSATDSFDDAPNVKVYNENNWNDDWIGSGSSISDGKINIAISEGSYAFAYQNYTYKVGATYTLTATVNGTAGKQFRVRDDSGNNGGLNLSNGIVTLDGTDQEIEFTWTALAGSDEIIFERHAGSGDWSFTVSDVKLVRSRADNENNWNDDWIGSGSSISDGKINIAISEGSYAFAYQNYTYKVGATYTLTATVNGTAGKQFRVRDDSGNNGGLNLSNGIVTLDGTDQEIEFTWTALAGSDEIIFERHAGSGDWSFTVSDVMLAQSGDSVILGFVDTDTPGEYEINYIATDSSGNSSSITRIVKVLSPVLDVEQKITKLIPNRNGGTINSLTLGFNSIPGSEYEILYSGDLSNWEVLNTVQSTGETTEVSIDVQTDDFKSLFYKVRTMLE